MNLGRKLVNGEYYDFIFKWADDRSHSIKGYADLRLWIKNKNSTVAKFRLAWEQANYSTSTSKNMEIPGGGDWNEYIIPLTELGSDSVAGLKISNPLGEYNGPDINADPINILIDSITVTDGTSNHSLSIPDAVHMPRPAKWPSSFLIGSFDNRDLFLWTRTISNRTGLPIVGWQVSEGNMTHPTTTLRDNAAETFLSHPDWWFNGGFIGILFGAGNSDCANYKNDNDGGWFVNHMKTYNENPYIFPPTGIKKNRLSETKYNRILILQNASGIRLSGWTGKADVKILSISGQLICHASCFPGEQISLPLIKTGLYLAVVSSSDGVRNERVIFTNTKYVRSRH